MFALLLALAVTAPFVQAEEEVMKNLSLLTWAHAVNNKTYLEATLASEVSMLEADVVMGQVTGRDGPPIPIMAHPPATTSDLSLADFLTTVSQYNNVNANQKGVKLDYKSIEAFESSQDLLAQFSKPDVTFPLWLNADILPGPVKPTATPVDPDRFLKLASKHRRAVLSVGWTTAHKENSSGGDYDRDQIGAMLRLLKVHRISQTVTFPLRAGLASNSQPIILDLLRESRYLNSTMTVWASEGDPIEIDRLRALILTVGLERCYLDVPSKLQARLRLPNPDVNAKI